MQELGFEQLKSDAGLFVYKRGNDSKSLVEKIKAAFMKKWEC